MMQKRSFSQDNLNLVPHADKLLSALIDRYRFSALGALVKGIVHNLNGSLQILSMQMELLQGILPKEGEIISPPVPAKVEKCLEQVDKMKALIDVLLQKGAYDGNDTPQMIHLNDLIEETLSLLKNNLFFKHQVKVKNALCPRLPFLKGYYIDFSEGLLNLIQNAIEAMEESPQKELTVLTETGHQYVQVIVRDTGCGISEGIKPYLFNPFFTTKGEDHYGLGLFMTRVLLTPYGASFNCGSRKGETLFSVHFPLPPLHTEPLRATSK